MSNIQIFPTPNAKRDFVAYTIRMIYGMNNCCQQIAFYIPNAYQCFLQQFFQR